MAVYDATNPKHVAIQRRSDKASQESVDAFLRHSMGLVDGRRYFYGLLVRCHVFANPYTGRAGTTAFACGELNVGQQVLADIMRIAPDEYVQMMREANARDIADDTRRTRSDEDSDRDDPGPVYIHPAFDQRSAGDESTRGTEDGDDDRDETDRDESA